MKILLLVHLLGVVIWVGGMFFAHMALRPAAAQVLEPPQRLRLMHAALRRFFVWVWVAVIAILLSGLAIIAQTGGFGGARWNVHAMFTIGLVMMAIFGHIYFAPYRRLTQSVAAGDWPAGAMALTRIRRLVGINLTLGLITIAIALLGRTA